MITAKHIVSGLLIGAFCVTTLPVFADSKKVCSPVGTYGYVYDGTSYTQLGPVPLTETGYFRITRKGHLTGEGTLAFYFSDFGGQGPVWLLIHEEQYDGMVSPDVDDTCTGTVEFKATGTVIKSSNEDVVSVGTVFFTDSDRSIAYTLSGRSKDNMDIVSTSPGTIASGNARIIPQARHHSED